MLMFVVIGVYGGGGWCWCWWTLPYSVSGGVVIVGVGVEIVDVGDVYVARGVWWWCVDSGWGRGG